MGEEEKGKNFLKDKKFIIGTVLAVISIAVAIFLGGGSRDQNVVGNANLIINGDHTIIYTEKQLSESRDLAVEVGLVNYFTVPKNRSGILINSFVNLYNVTFTLPTGQQVFFREFPHGAIRVYGLCNQTRTDCYVFPDYLYNPEKDISCVSIKQESWEENNFVLNLNPDNRDCVQDILSS